jgi:hypothetical protein
MPAPERGLVFTGARARFLIEGTRVGWATNVSGGEEIQYDPIEVLDNIQVQEFVPVAYRATLTASRIRIVGKTFKSQGWFPKLGANAEEHLRNILAAGVLAASVEDNQSGSILANYDTAKIASHNYTVNARGAVGNDVNFVVTRMADESEI